MKPITPPLNSEPGVGTESPHTELRLFLGQLFFPKERIWFHPVMPQKIFDRYRTDARALATLEERHLVSDRFNYRSEWIGHRPLSATRPRSTTLQSRQFNSIIAHLRDLNSLGYDIHVGLNPRSFARPCQRTVRGVRSVVLAGGGRHKPKWLDWLVDHRRYALAAVDSGSLVQICIRTIRSAIASASRTGKICRNRGKTPRSPCRSSTTSPAESRISPSGMA